MTKFEIIQQVIRQDWGDLYDFVERVDRDFILRIFKSYTVNLDKMKEVRSKLHPNGPLAMDLLKTIEESDKLLSEEEKPSSSDPSTSNEDPNLSLA